METKQFIEDAIKGGWRKDEDPQIDQTNDGPMVLFHAGNETGVQWEADVLLDPLAWQAVGKTRGWSEPKECISDGEYATWSTTPECVAVGFFQDVMYGKSIEEALAAIK